MESRIDTFEPPLVSHIVERNNLNVEKSKAVKVEKDTKSTENNYKKPEVKQKLEVGGKAGFFVVRAVESANIKGVEADSRTRVEEMMKHPYIKRQSIMTQAELRLYKLLLKIVPDKVIIAPKVRIADILDVHESLKDSADSPIYKITNKHIDYTVCDAITLEPICLIELDDRYHYRSSKIERDKFVENIMEDVGLKLFRVKKKITDVTEDDLYYIKEYIYNRYAPMCEMCGAPMIFKQSKQKGNYGHMFYCCSNFWSDKRCYWKVNIGY